MTSSIVAALAQRTWATYRSPERLRLHLEPYHSYHHFVAHMRA